MNTMIELFSGSGTMSKVFKQNDWETLAIDKRKRKGICVPDIKINIIDLSPVHFCETIFQLANNYLKKYD